MRIDQRLAQFSRMSAEGAVEAATRAYVRAARERAFAGRGANGPLTSSDPRLGRAAPKVAGAAVFGQMRVGVVNSLDGADSRISFSAGKGGDIARKMSEKFGLLACDSHLKEEAIGEFKRSLGMR